MEKLYENYPIDLLQIFTAATKQYDEKQQQQQQQHDEEDDIIEGEREEIELNLGLSLGGRFGIDKNCSNKLVRSASVASIPSVTSAVMEPVLFPMIVRTSSLPTETEEEWNMRKSLQTLRRMEAKRRRSQKSAAAAAVKNEECLKGEGRKTGVPVNLREKKYIFNASVGGGDKLGESTGLTSWAAATGLHLNSQGSVESRGGSSSGMSDFETKQLQGPGSAGKPISPASIQSLQEQSNHETSSVGKAAPRVHNTSEKSGGRMGLSAMGDMPCVFTKGDGPNGRRVDGILYKYNKGEEVRIMCVCHGSFLSPAEFVKHAGGGDVAHPLRHIVVNPSSNLFL